MRALPLQIGTIHFVGIGGIGMSGIAEVLHVLGYSVQGSDLSESANVQRLRAAGIPVTVGHAAANLGDAQVVVISTAVGPRQSRSGRRPLQADPRGAPRGNARRADAPALVGGRRWHARQDHHHQPDRRRARSGPSRSHRDQRRHHRGLRQQHPHGLGRLDGGRGRRERRLVPAPSRRGGRGHQHGRRASRPLGNGRGDAGRLRPVRLQHPVLRLRRPLHRPSRSAEDDPASVGSSRHHLRFFTAGRCPRRAHRQRQARRHVRGRGHRPAAQPQPTPRPLPPADAGPAQRAERARRRRDRPRDGDRRRDPCARPSRSSAASSGASRKPARSAASP